MEMPKVESFFVEEDENDLDSFDLDNIPSFDEWSKAGKIKKVRIPIVLSEIFPEQLLQCEVGCEIRLWTREHYAHINGYREETFNGEGKSLVLIKADNPDIDHWMRLGHPICFVVTKRQGDKLRLRLTVDFTRGYPPETPEELAERVRRILNS